MSLTKQELAENLSKADEHSEEYFQAPPCGFGKRLFDLLVSATSLIILSPIFGLIAMAIKRDSPGPVIFHGDRSGLGGKPFKIHKFRTMYDTPACKNGSPITGNDDARVTRYGKWLRDTKLNELPQLWNVLVGEMSIVGPRPEYPGIAETWPENVRKEVLSVKPGITSPASIVYRDEEKQLQGSGFMDTYLLKILPDKLRLDQLYVENRSFLTDLDLIFMTLIVILPRLRKLPMQEKRLFTGPFYVFFHRVLTWFLVDIAVTFFMVGLSGLVWRVSAVINLGIWVYLLLSFAIAIVVSTINTLLGLQRVNWSKASPSYIFDIAFSISTTMFLLWLVTHFWITQPWIPFSLIWLMGTMIFIGLIAVRYRERLITGMANRWLLMRGGAASIAERILVVGSGELGELAIWLMQRSKFSNVFGIVGIVDDDVKKQDMQLFGFRILGTTQDIPKLVEKHKIGIIMYAIANISAKEKERVLAACAATDARLIIIPDLVKVMEKSFMKMEAESE